MEFIDNLLNHKQILVLGPGGVGKTTITTSLALTAAQQRKKTLAITIDPSLRLKDALGLKGPTAEPVQIRENLWALILDTKLEMDRFLTKRISNPDDLNNFINNPFYEKAAARAVGMHEYMAMIRLYEEYTSEKWDVVITDTPPSEHAIDFLEAPNRLQALVSHESFKAASKLIKMSRRGVLNLSNIIRKGLAKFVDLKTFFGLLEFVLSLGGVYDELDNISKETIRIIRGEDNAVVVVTTPQSRRIDDVISLIDALGQLNIIPDYIFVNQVFMWRKNIPKGKFGADHLMDLFAQPQFIGVSRPEISQLLRQIDSTIHWFDDMVRFHRSQIEKLDSFVNGSKIFLLPNIFANQKDTLQTENFITQAIKV